MPARVFRHVGSKLVEREAAQTGEQSRCGKVGPACQQVGSKRGVMGLGAQIQLARDDAQCIAGNRQVELGAAADQRLDLGIEPFRHGGQDFRATRLASAGFERWSGRGQCAGPLGCGGIAFKQQQQVKLLLGAAPCDHHALDRPVVPGAPESTHLQAAKRPPEGAIDQPEAEPGRVKGIPASCLIGLGKILNRPKAVGRPIGTGKAPHGHAAISQVFMAVAKMGQFPVEHTRQVAAIDQQVAQAKIAMDQARRNRFG